MNNSRMTRVAKILDIIANAGGTITFVVGIICMVVAILTLIFGDRMFAEGSVTLDLDFIKFHLNDNAYVNERLIKLFVVASTFGGGIICFFVYYAAKLFRRILAPMKAGRPFESGISGNLKKIGWSVLIGGLLSETVGVAARILLVKAYSIEELFASAAIAKTEVMFTMNFDFVLIACVIFFLSYIFAYGQALQQESDETL